jgi:hypothetical protein
MSCCKNPSQSPTIALRFPVLLLASILALSGSATDAPRPQRLLFLSQGQGQPADTGDTVLGLTVRRPASRASAGDSVGRRLTECPMPVERPDPGLSIPIPTKRDLAPEHPLVVPGRTLPGESGMPVVRSGCWNPLDGLRRGQDSTKREGKLQPRP